MKGLMLHCGANHADIDDVRATATPKPQGAHFPISHAHLFDTVFNGLHDAGYAVHNVAHALTREGSRYFGMIELRHTNAEYSLIVGLRNTHDKSWAASLVMGNRVFVCDNLSFSGEVLIGRKHTKRILDDLPLLVPRAIEALSFERLSMERRISAYRNFRLWPSNANTLILDACARRKIFPPRMIPKIVAEWDNPSHDEWKGRNAWSLFNAFTECAKDGAGNPGRLADRTRRLHGLFTEYCRVELPTKEEVLTDGLTDAIVKNDAFNRNPN